MNLSNPRRTPTSKKAALLPKKATKVVEDTIPASTPINEPNSEKICANALDLIDLGQNLN